jgi:hypothetical protein
MRFDTKDLAPGTTEVFTELSSAATAPLASFHALYDDSKINVHAEKAH